MRQPAERIASIFEGLHIRPFCEIRPSGGVESPGHEGSHSRRRANRSPAVLRGLSAYPGLWGYCRLGFWFFRRSEGSTGIPPHRRAGLNKFWLN